MQICYNLYYKGNLINRSPITEAQLLEIYNNSNGKLYKKNKFSNTKTEIKLKDIQVVKCIIV